jgi:two-component system, OmpR family, phosphate regulon response regulator PhoB
MAGPRSHRPHRLVLTDDDVSLTSPLSYTLETAGFDVKVAATGNAALEMVVEHVPEVVLLDVMLPDISGLEVCRRIRTTDLAFQPAIIVVTAKVEESDRIAGFAAGADDFVTKPFSISELILRIRARMKVRPASESPVESPPKAPPAPAGSIAIGPLLIDGASYRVFLCGKEVKLSVQEMRLLRYLASEPGRMRTRQDLLTDVWGYHPEASSRTLDTHIKRLRDKFGDLGGMIQTAYGVGYRLTPEPTEMSGNRFRSRRGPGR